MRDNTFHQKMCDTAAQWGCDPVYDKPPRLPGDGYRFYNFNVDYRDPEFLKEFLPAIDRTLLECQYGADSTRNLEQLRAYVQTLLNPQVDGFTAAYIEAMLCSSCDEQDNKRRAALEAGYSVQVGGKVGPSGGDVYWVRIPEENNPEGLPLGFPNPAFQFEYESDAWDAAWEHMGGGSADTALDANYGLQDLAPETLESIKADCAQFQQENAKDLEQACEEPNGYRKIASGIASWRHAGHDFWLTRNRHGCGFWDGDLPDELGDRLTEATHKFKEIHPYVSGDDGKIYTE